MKITCAFQYELYVDETRRAALSRNAGCRRFVFNKALGIQNERKSKGEKLLTYKELAHELVLWKKQPETAFLREAKKHIAHVVSVGEQGFWPEDSMPSMGTALEPRDRVVQGIPAL